MLEFSSLLPSLRVTSIATIANSPICGINHCRRRGHRWFCHCMCVTVRKVTASSWNMWCLSHVFHGSHHLFTKFSSTQQLWIILNYSLSLRFLCEIRVWFILWGAGISVPTFIHCTCSLRWPSVCPPPDCGSSVMEASYWPQSASSREPPSHHARRSVQGCGLSPSAHSGSTGQTEMSFNILIINNDITFILQ